MGDKYLLRNAWPICLLVSPGAVVTLPFSPGWSGELGGGCVRTGSFFFLCCRAQQAGICIFIVFFRFSASFFTLLLFSLIPLLSLIQGRPQTKRSFQLIGDVLWQKHRRGPWECVCACVCDFCCSDAISVPVVCLSEKPLLFLLIRFTETGVKPPEC